MCSGPLDKVRRERAKDWHQLLWNCMSLKQHGIWGMSWVWSSNKICMLRQDWRERAERRPSPNSLNYTCKFQRVNLHSNKPKIKKYNLYVNSAFVWGSSSFAKSTNLNKPCYWSKLELLMNNSTHLQPQSYSKILTSIK